MKAKDFQALLLRAAVVAIASDGEVAEAEKQELANIASSTAYFLGFDHATLLPRLFNDQENVGPDAVALLAKTVREAQLNERQVPVLLDVLLRVIEADQVVRAAERFLLEAVTTALHLSDGWLFGHYPRLIEYRQNTDSELQI